MADLAIKDVGGLAWFQSAKKAFYEFIGSLLIDQPLSCSNIIISNTVLANLNKYQVYLVVPQ